MIYKPCFIAVLIAKTTLPDITFTIFGAVILENSIGACCVLSLLFLAKTTPNMYTCTIIRVVVLEMALVHTVFISLFVLLKRF